MRKHGVDLDDGGADGGKTRRLDRKEVDRIMGGGDGQGVFTWREKNRKKVSLFVVLFSLALKRPNLPARILRLRNELI